MTKCNKRKWQTFFGGFLGATTTSSPDNVIGKLPMGKSINKLNDAEAEFSYIQRGEPFVMLTMHNA